MAKEDIAKKENPIIETVKTVVYALVLAGLFRTLFFQPFWIPSGSMKSTLLIGDFLFVNKMAYGYSYASCPSIPFSNITPDKICGFLSGDNERIWAGEPKRGDVVVFRHPVHGTDYIKRLIGTPGDTVQMKDGRLILNGKEVDFKEDGKFTEIMELQGSMRRQPRCANAPVGLGGICEKERGLETLPSGKSYVVLNISNQGSDNTGVYTVPQGHYFFIGDNRDNSTDSRFRQNYTNPSASGVGYVKFEDIIGRADRIMFSSAGKSMLFFWTWRSDRFFQAVI